MRVVWAQSLAVSVADVHAGLPDDLRSSAYTTVKTTLERLADKGILSQMRAGKAYLYRAAVTQAELERRIVSKALDSLVARFPDAVASFFVRPDLAVSDDRLALLEEAIARRRAAAEEKRDG